MDVPVARVAQFSADVLDSLSTIRKTRHFRKLVIVTLPCCAPHNWSSPKDNTYYNDGVKGDDTHGGNRDNGKLGNTQQRKERAERTAKRGAGSVGRQAANAVAGPLRYDIGVMAAQCGKRSTYGRCSESGQDQEGSPNMA
jgi:hypothetical protein